MDVRKCTRNLQLAEARIRAGGAHSPEVHTVVELQVLLRDLLLHHHLETCFWALLVSSSLERPAPSLTLPPRLLASPAYKEMVFPFRLLGGKCIVAMGGCPDLYPHLYQLWMP